MYIDRSKTYIGIVEDNMDPKKLGRVKARVIDIFEEIPTEAIPWAHPFKDLNGNEFNVPDKGKIVTIIFDQGNIEYPEYIYAEHYNINLEKKLKNLSDEDYRSFKSIFIDHSTQIYRSDSEGLKIDHEYTNINLDKNGNILANLRDNNSVITLGSSDASEEAVLGTTFFNWMDSLVDNLNGNSGGPFLGNMGAPVMPNPGMISCLQEYQSLRSKFVSDHVRIVANQEVKAQKRPYEKQYGDNYKSTTNPNNLTTKESPPYTPEDSENGGQPSRTNPAENKPGEYSKSLNEPTTASLKGKYENGKLPSSVLVKSKWLSKQLSEDNYQCYLAKDAAISFDKMIDNFMTTFAGKRVIVFNDGYRTYERQVSMKKKYGSKAATPGTSNHGWGLAVDISVGGQKAYNSQIYKWLFENGWKFGWYNPVKLRDKSGLDEAWHWEYHGLKGQPEASKYTLFNGSSV